MLLPLAHKNEKRKNQKGKEGQLALSTTPYKKRMHPVITMEDLTRLEGGFEERWPDA